MVNFALNTTRDEAITSPIYIQEELNFYMSDTFKKNIINDFKSLIEYNEEIGHEVGLLLDKDCVHIIYQLHPHFKDNMFL